ncbi:hypothetical protein Taro_033612, partial [Colocasia esculenta]|nr:hypothetical protein [Colocasia esculenta]
VLQRAQKADSIAEILLESSPGVSAFRRKASLLYLVSIYMLGAGYSCISGCSFVSTKLLTLVGNVTLLHAPTGRTFLFHSQTLCMWRGVHLFLILAKLAERVLDTSCAVPGMCASSSFLPPQVTRFCAHKGSCMVPAGGLGVLRTRPRGPTQGRDPGRGASRRRHHITSASSLIGGKKNKKIKKGQAFRDEGVRLLH